MKRPVLIHVVLLGLAMVTAYFVWTREPSSTVEEIKILSLRSNLDKVIFSTKDRIVEATRRKDKTGPYYQVTVTTEKNAPPKPTPKPKAATTDGGAVDGGVADGAADKASTKSPATDAQATGAVEKTPKKPKTPPPKIREIKRFKGNQNLENMVKNLAQMSAVRTLGIVDKEKLKAFGLAESKKTLTLVVGSTPRVFLIGGTTYGNSDTYIQDRQDKRVYVIRQRLIQNFQYAEFRLMDRRPHVFIVSDIDKVVFSAKGKKKVLKQKNRRHPTKATWVDDVDPEKQKTFYKNWMGKLNRLQISEYVSTDSKIKNLQELMRAEYFLGRKEKGFLVLYKGQTENTQKGPTPVLETNFYIETENSRGKALVNKRQGDELERDIDNLFKE